MLITASSIGPLIRKSYSRFHSDLDYWISLHNIGNLTSGNSTAQVARGQFKAERKHYRNRWADLRNRVVQFRDNIFPGEFTKIHKTISPYSMMSHARLRGIYDGICKVEKRGILGDLVECGTARGGCAALMGLTCSDTSPSRKLWIFDTFEGLPAPSPNDPDFELAKDREGDCKGNIDEVRALLGRLNVNCEPVLVKGLFQDTIPDSSVKQIAFLHLDGDWYDSTIVCLEHLYDKVATGGIIQIDDYGHWAGARKALHEFLEKRNICVDLEYLDYTGRQFTKP